MDPENAISAPKSLVPLALEDFLDELRIALNNDKTRFNSWESEST